MASHDHDHDNEKKSAGEKKPVLLLAEFDSTAKIFHAAEKVRDAGFTRWDVHTPFPIHGMDGAMGLPDSRLGWIVAAMALTGFCSALGMIYYMNVVDYPLIIGGKPPWSIPSVAPVAFELTILFSAFGAVFGMFGINRLPRHHHPIFFSQRFERATDDRFFVSIEVDDPKYDEKKTRKLLEDAHATHIEVIEEEVV
ncbi:MAG: DUF3341 domain-containing protein [Myxococcales bacterium]|nr:DUF3341 domain-containing protein [Myxococcales bacterium]